MSSRGPSRRIGARCLLGLACGLLAGAVGRADPAAEPGLLFHLSGDRGLTADVAAPGQAEPNFASGVDIVADGAHGPGVQCAHTQVYSYRAPGNVFAERGTLAFFWRAREPVGPTEFPIFRVGYADHSSWDMAWLRIDYNGKPGFDAFVTDTSLARTRVSHTMAAFPGPKTWVHLALEWDETQGLRFYVDGALVARRDGTARLSAALDQFGPHSRIISPYQVQSAYNFVRGGDIDEVRIYDRMIGDENVARLARGEAPGALPPIERDVAEPGWRDAWWHRFGWNRPEDPPPPLDAEAVSVRKVEVHDAYDVKRWWWKATDGIRETTWPGVYNRSKLPGRTDYFVLPDWDCYSVSGRSVQFAMPDEPWNHLEVSGAAFGTLSLVPAGVPPPDPTATAPVSAPAAAAVPLADRPPGQERTAHRLARPVRGQQVRFTNVEPETPIGEFGAYYVSPGSEPRGTARLTYRLTAGVEPAYASLQPALAFLTGRHPADERQVMVGLPPDRDVPRVERNPKPAGLPLVHVLLPADFRDAPFGNWRGGNSYTWTNLDGGLDGIAIDLPPLAVRPTHGALFPLNVSVKDPLWPLRTMLDISVSVEPRQRHTVWLDLRDRILPRGRGLYLTIAGAGADFGPAALEGTEVRLIFKPAAEARAEHVLDRFTQVRDNFAHIVEERPNTHRLSLYSRFEADLTDLLAVDPAHARGREYWHEYNPEQPRPPMALPEPPAGTPRWAYRQVHALRQVREFVTWFIDHRQIANGEFGGGLSDDGDLTNWWPGTAMMGAAPDAIRASLLREMEAFYAQGLFAGGLPAIQTDELHSYEEGIQVLGQAMLLDFGGPAHLERAMETARAIEERLTAINDAGHRHIVSSYFSGTRVATDSVWGWSKPQSYLILHPAIALVDFNGAPRVRRWLLELADGLLAHARTDGQGRRSLRAAIHFASDEDRPAPFTDRTLPLLWAAYRWTGDRKYVTPILDEGLAGLQAVAANALDVLDLRASVGPTVLAAARGSKDPWTRHLAWQVSGDTTWLDALYEDQIQAAAAREYINTQGSVWTDRASIRHGELQRARLGGLALTRNAYVPGQAISWTFERAGDEERVAVLVPDATRTRLGVIAHNLGPAPVSARVRGWDVDPGVWRVTEGGRTREVAWGRSDEVAVTLPPGTTTTIEFALVTAGVPYWGRPDLGIGEGDVRVREGRLLATVHSLGAVDAPRSRLVVRDRRGRRLGEAAVTALPAPRTLRPVTAQVTVRLPGGADLDGATVDVEPPAGTVEITQMNNRTVVPARTAHP